MSRRAGDLFGWVLAGAAAGLTLAALRGTDEHSTTLLAWAVLILVFADRLPVKVLTAKTIRIVDSAGAIRGLIGHVADGIQLGVREPLGNMAVSPALLWGDVPNVSFNFRYQEVYTQGRVLTEINPSFEATGYGERGYEDYKNYRFISDFAPRWSNVEAELEREKPAKEAGKA
jgi:hypothetical protein